MNFLLSALAFFVLLTVLVLFHEFGHFFAARWFNVKVEEFGFGLPPRVKTLFFRGGTRFSLNWIPFGGFVRLQGENAVTEAERRSVGSFGRASVLARIIILTAGVGMNFLFAVVIFTIGFSFARWVPTYLTFEDMQAAAARGDIHMVPAVLIDDVISGAGAAKVGVPARSILLSVDGTPVTLPTEVTALQKGKRSVRYTILTGDELAEKKTFTVPLTEEKAGVSLRPFPRELSSPQRSFVDALGLSLREAKVMTVQTVIGMAKLFQSLAQTGRVPEGITGIVGIAQLTHVSVQDGFMTYLRLVALLSLSLAVLNILPLPALDGGRLLFVLLEVVLRKPANRRFELMTNAVGFAFLLLLIVLITYHDILRLFL
ncbi:site-2 protease family protein [Candidatus Peregrinibacteria bacterium]|nr:site-2 protease family protein [Candidatus Peregrinibacteria bacterium]